MLIAQCFPAKPDRGRQRASSELIAEAEDLRKRQTRARELFDTATTLLGGEHALLTLGPVAYKQCDRAAKCDRSVRWGGDLALWAALPLWGLGGGHGSDWFPALETSEQREAHQAFTEMLVEYARKVSALAKHDVATNALRVHVAELRASVRAVAEAGFARDVEHYELARSIVECLDYEQRVNAALDPLDKSEIEEYAGRALLKASRVREQFRIAVGPELAFTHKGDQLCSVCGGEPLSCYTVLGDHLRQQVEQLKLLTEMLRDYVVPAGRHALLTGPAFGVPLSRDPLSGFYFGGIVELGGWVSVTVGVLGTYDNLRFFNGFFVGFGLSGVPGDHLWHFLDGGHDAAQQVEATSW